MKGLGIGEQLLHWLSSLLPSRPQRVILNGEASDWGPVDSGVAQGSLLGPVLFVVHINNIDLVVVGAD